jgi:type III pantothenate kinase
VIRIVADLGNTRLKCAEVRPDGSLGPAIALPIDEPGAWPEALDRLAPGAAETSWAISTVNPPLAGRLSAWLEGRGVSGIRWFRSAANVRVPHELDRPDTAGADRALAVLAARSLNPPGRPGLVVSCGTALTVERISPAGVWQGGAIAPGLGLSARALHQGTAQLPLIDVAGPPPPLGRSTTPALAAGVFWGTVGAARELIGRQSAGLTPSPYLVWTGGDAPMLAPWVDGGEPRIVPDLVLIGVARAAYGPDSGAAT